MKQAIVATLCLILSVSASAASARTDSSFPAQNPLASTSDSYVGTFKNDELQLTLKAEGAGYVGTLTREGKSYPISAQKEGSKLSGKLKVGEESYPFSLELRSGELLMTSDFGSHTLRRATTGTNPLSGGSSTTSKREDNAPAGRQAQMGDWKTIKHPTGLYVRYPGNWTAKQEEHLYQLIPNDAAADEIIIVMGRPAEGITDPKDANLGLGIEAIVTEEISPNFRKKGGAQSATAGNGKGVLYTFEAPHASGNGTVECRVYATVLKTFAVGVVAVMPTDKMAKRAEILKQIFATMNAGEAEIDRNLVGAWSKTSENTIDAQSSGGRRAGDASLVGNKQSRFQLNADGTFICRESNYTIASGSGVFVESKSDNTYEGSWSAADGKLVIVWSDGSMEEYRYTVQGNQVVLRGMGKEIVYSRG